MGADPIRVLLVEDNPGDALLIKSYLQEGGPRPFAVATVERLADALRHLAEQAVDVVLLDLSLPDSDGWQTFAELQKRARQVPVVILTGVQDGELALRAMAGGAQDYLVKGEISGSLLVRTLNYAIERAHLLGRQRRLNRALNVLSEINQTVVRATGEQQLLDRACAILVGSGGYRLALVGTYDEEGTRDLRPRAWSGEAVPLLDALWGAGFGHDGRNLAPDGVHVLQDVRHDPAAAPWRAAALAHGIRAAAVLPLESGGRLFGVMHLFARETEAFDPDEMQLLLEVVGDVAYGLETLQTNRALRQSEEKFARAFQASPIGIALTTADDRIVDVNESTLRLFGYEREDVVGRTSAELDVWTDRSWRDDVAAILKNGSGCRDLEVEARSITGERRHVLASFERIDVGDDVSVLSLLHDITDRKVAEEKQQQYNERLTVLREIEQAILGARSPASIAQATLSHLKRLIPHQRAAITLFDSERQHVTVLAATGHGDGQIRDGERFARALYDDIAGLARGEYHIVEDVQQCPMHDRYRHLLGSGLNALVVVPLLTSNRLIGALNLAATAPGAFSREHAEIAQEVAGSLAVALQNAQLLQQTQAQARQMQQIVETVPEGMILLDAAQRIVLLNPTAATYLADLCPIGVGEPLTRLAQEPLARFLEPQADGLPWHELVLKEGGRVFEVAAQPIAEERQTRGWVLVLRDVTEERERQRYLQAQDRLATVGQLAAGIAHDFNNIMAIITLYSEALERRPDFERRLHYLRTMREQAGHAARLIEQILDFSRRSVVEQSRLELGPFVKEVVKLLRRTLPETVAIQFSPDEQPHPVNVDPTRLQQVLMNLAINARDAMPAGGRLEISLAGLTLAPDQRPPLPGMAAGEWVRLSVADTGTGIRPEDLPHVFEPFFTTKQASGGTGLGLAQVYGIIKQHEGEIDVHSEPGEGTRFDIYLPALSSNEARPEPAGGAALADGQGRLILLVEDNQAARNAIADVLEMLNYRVLAVEDGEAALRAFKAYREEIVLVVSDMVMPGMSGAELYRELRRQQPDVNVVMMTGYAPVERQELVHQGVVAWLQKPFEAEKLTEAIERALGEPA